MTKAAVYKDSVQRRATNKPNEIKKEKEKKNARKKERQHIIIR